MLGRNAEDARNPGEQVHEQIDAAAGEAGDPDAGAGQSEAPVMPAPPFLTFSHRPTLPHQVPGVGFESGRDSRAR